jgi:Asp-tRNA(Asn)/Glu-tRNA(Gln) amidotransferase A subunit family amidase
MTAPELSVAAMATGESNTALVLQLTKHIFLGNLLGLPALSVPVGVDPNSMLPIGAQLVGSWWSEARLLELAAAIENMRLARQ